MYKRSNSGTETMPSRHVELYPSDSICREENAGNMIVDAETLAGNLERHVC